MFTVCMKTDNAAFADYGTGAELARILRKLADELEPASGRDLLELDQGALHDANGNGVGHWTYDGRR